MRNCLILSILFFAACSNAPMEPVSASDTTKKVPAATTVVEKTPTLTVKRLTEYEWLINKYIIYSKKAKQGDVSALSECTSISVEAKNVESVLLDQAKELTEVQQNKLRELTVNFEKVSNTK